jgi:hypothetical protein
MIYKKMAHIYQGVQGEYYVIDGIKYDVHFPQELHGPIWCVLDEHGNMDPAYPTWELKLAASRGRHA